MQVKWNANGREMLQKREREYAERVHADDLRALFYIDTDGSTLRYRFADVDRIVGTVLSPEAQDITSEQEMERRRELEEAQKALEEAQRRIHALAPGPPTAPQRRTSRDARRVPNEPSVPVDNSDV